jgi:hypothetical protein
MADDKSVTWRRTLRADGTDLKDAVTAWVGGGHDPEQARQRAQLREKLGLSSFDDQPWAVISPITKTEESALDYLLREALRVGLERVAPGVELVTDEIIRGDGGVTGQ